jgi:hypothetical protein
MNRLARFQIIGPLALLAAMATAEGAAWALSQMPTSELLWFINLQLFGLFQKSNYLVGELVAFPYAQLAIAAVLGAAAVAGAAFRSRLALSIASNLSFFFVCATGYAAATMDSFAPAAAANGTAQALVQIVLPHGADAWLLLILLAVTLPSFVISHLIYIRAARARG